MIRPGGTGRHLEVPVPVWGYQLVNFKTPDDILPFASSSSSGKTRVKAPPQSTHMRGKMQLHAAPSRVNDRMSFATKGRNLSTGEDEVEFIRRTAQESIRLRGWTSSRHTWSLQWKENHTRSWGRSEPWSRILKSSRELTSAVWLTRLVTSSVGAQRLEVQKGDWKKDLIWMTYWKGNILFGCLEYICIYMGDFSTQLCGIYKNPLSGSLRYITNQCNVRFPGVYSLPDL